MLLDSRVGFIGGRSISRSLEVTGTSDPTHDDETVMNGAPKGAPAQVLDWRAAANGARCCGVFRSPMSEGVGSRSDLKCWSGRFLASRRTKSRAGPGVCGAGRD